MTVQRNNRRATKPLPNTPKKSNKVTPTHLQTIAVKKLVEISRNAKGQKRITLGRVLKEAGYAPSMVNHPKRVTKSKGWNQLMEKYFPDDVLAQAEKGQLNASEIGHYIFPASEKDIEIKKIIESFPNCKLTKIRKQLNWKRAYFYSPDNTAIGKSLDRIYNLKNKYPPKENKITGTIETVEIVKYAEPTKPNK